MPLKLFLDIGPSSYADMIRALGGCFRGGSVCVVSFRFKAKENLQCCGSIFLVRKGASALGMFKCISKLSDRSLTKTKRRMSLAQTTTLNERRELFRGTSAKRTNVQPQAIGNRTNRWSKVQAGIC